MLRYVTSILLCCFTTIIVAQESTQPVVKDTTSFKKTYGLRIGIDAASLLHTGIDDAFNGFQIMADYRINSRWYAAGELGNESFETLSDRVDGKTTGAYLKAGADYNFYQNWLDMDNMVYIGMRAGYATMSQDLNRYSYYQDNTYFPIDPNTAQQSFSGLNAIWVEMQLGLKVEVLTNFYLGATVQLKRSVAQSTPDGFDNLYIPGFGKTNDTGNIGVGYSYGISYRIPIYRK